MNHSIRPFGSSERNFTEKEKQDVRTFLRNTNYLTNTQSRMLETAASESEWFKNAGRVLGGLNYLAFYFAPVIRRQHAILRYSASLRRTFLAHPESIYLELKRFQPWFRQALQTFYFFVLRLILNLLTIRFALPLIPAYWFISTGNTQSEELEWTRTYHIWQGVMVYNGGSHKLVF